MIPIRFKRAPLIALALVAFMVSGWVSPFASPRVSAQTNSLARLEPEAGTYFGVALDWSRDSAADFNGWAGAAIIGGVAIGTIVTGLRRRRRRRMGQPSLAWVYVERGSGRDLRIDLLRGVAMLFVVVNHIDKPSLYHLLSQERIGVVSGAELFVTLAGIVVGMIFRRRITEQRWVSELWRLILRARLLYRVAVVVVVSVYILSLVPRVDARVRVSTTSVPKVTLRKSLTRLA